MWWRITGEVWRTDRRGRTVWREVAPFLVEATDEESAIYSGHCVLTPFADPDVRTRLRAVRVGG